MANTNTKKDDLSSIITSSYDKTLAIVSKLTTKINRTIVKSNSQEFALSDLTKLQGLLEKAASITKESDLKMIDFARKVADIDYKVFDRKDDSKTGHDIRSIDDVDGLNPPLEQFNNYYQGSNISAPAGFAAWQSMLVGFKLAELEENASNKNKIFIPAKLRIAGATNLRQDIITHPDKNLKTVVFPHGSHVPHDSKDVNYVMDNTKDSIANINRRAKSVLGSGDSNNINHYAITLVSDIVPRDINVISTTRRAIAKLNSEETDTGSEKYFYSNMAIQSGNAIWAPAFSQEEKLMQESINERTSAAIKVLADRKVVQGKKLEEEDKANVLDNELDRLEAESGAASTTVLPVNEVQVEQIRTEKEYLDEINKEIAIASATVKKYEGKIDTVYYYALRIQSKVAFIASIALSIAAIAVFFLVPALSLVALGAILAISFSIPPLVFLYKNNTAKILSRLKLKFEEKNSYLTDLKKLIELLRVEEDDVLTINDSKAQVDTAKTATKDVDSEKRIEVLRQFGNLKKTDYIKQVNAAYNAAVGVRNSRHLQSKVIFIAAIALSIAVIAAMVTTLAAPIAAPLLAIMVIAAVALQYNLFEKSKFTSVATALTKSTFMNPMLYTIAIVATAVFFLAPPLSLAVLGVMLAVSFSMTALVFLYRADTKLQNLLGLGLGQNRGMGLPLAANNTYIAALACINISLNGDIADIGCQEGEDRTGAVLIMRKALEKFYIEANKMPDLNNKDDLKKLADYVADEFNSGVDAKVAGKSTAGGDGIKNFNAYMPAAIFNNMSSEKFALVIENTKKYEGRAKLFEIGASNKIANYEGKEPNPADNPADNIDRPVDDTGQHKYKQMEVDGVYINWGSENDLDDENYADTDQSSNNNSSYLVTFYRQPLLYVALASFTVFVATATKLTLGISLPAFLAVTLPIPVLQIVALATLIIAGISLYKATHNTRSALPVELSSGNDFESANDFNRIDKKDEVSSSSATSNSLNKSNEYPRTEEDKKTGAVKPRAGNDDNHGNGPKEGP